MHLANYSHNGKWKREIKIIICETQSNFDVEDVQYALRLWKKEVQGIYVRSRCDYEIKRGEIKIIDSKMIDVSQYWALTTYNFYRAHDRNGVEYRVFTGALIQLDRSVNNIELLIHEMGHAFGYSHYDEFPDVMNTIKYF